MTEEIKSGTAPDQQQEKTFTQEQVNAIIGKRLAEAKTSAESELAKRESELRQREMGIKARELLAKKNLPKELAEVLRYEDDKSLEAAISAIEKVRGLKKEEAPGKEEHRLYKENKLPVPEYGYGGHDLIRDAFQPKG